MPDLHPIVRYLDETIRDTISGLHYAVKWKRAYYELPDRGWIIPLVPEKEWQEIANRRRR